MVLRVFRVSPLEPCGPLNQLGYDFCKHTFRLVLRTIYRMSLADVRPLPETGPVIIAPNHRSFLDPLAVGCSFDRRSWYMMNGKYYDVPALNWFFRMSRVVVVEDERDNRAALRAAKTILDAGKPLVIFPEGHISPDGELKAGQPGVAWLAHKTGAPVIPVHVGGTREALAKGDKRLHLSRVTIRTGEPLRIDDFPEGREGQVAFTQAVMDAIAGLGRLSAARRR